MEKAAWAYGIEHEEGVELVKRFGRETVCSGPVVFWFCSVPV